MPKDYVSITNGLEWVEIAYRIIFLTGLYYSNIKVMSLWELSVCDVCVSDDMSWEKKKKENTQLASLKALLSECHSSE